MSKLAIIGIVIAGLATPATAAANHGAAKARPHHRQTVRSCLQAPIFPPGKDATMCGPQVFRNGITVWVRDPATGVIVPISGGKWRTEDGR